MIQGQQQPLCGEPSFKPTQKQYTQLRDEFNKQNVRKNICFMVIFIIIFINYIQVRTLKSEYQALQHLNNQLTKHVKANIIELEKQKRYRVGNMTQFKQDYQSQVNSLRRNTQDNDANIKSEIIQLKQRFSNLQGIFNKYKNKNSKQSKQLVHNNNNNLQIKVMDRIQLQFILSQSRHEYYEYKMRYLKSLLTRQIFNNQIIRDSYLTLFSNYISQYNNIIEYNLNRQISNKNYNRLNKKYNLEEIKYQLEFCIVIPTFNNAQNYRYQYNLQSIFNLNYTNYKIIIIDDASTDHTYQLISKYISKYNHKINIVLLQNQIQLTAVPNINRAIREYCNPSDIVLLVDGDDQLIVKDSLKVFNSIYQRQQVDVVYSNHLKLYWHQDQVYQGWSAHYSDQQKKQNMYRDVPQKISHLRSFKASLFLKIKQQDLKDEYGSWLKSAYDEVICLPILEMSCGRIAYIEQYFYLYNFGIGSNDLMVNQNLQKKVADYVKFNKKKYSCIEKISNT